MNKKLFKLSLILVVFLTGCASIKSNPSGFLENYSDMKESNYTGGLFIEKDPFVDITTYKKVLIHPVVLHFRPDARGISIDPVKLKEHTDYFYEQIVAFVGETHEIVEASGPGVLEVRSAITEIVPNKIYLNLHWTTTLSKAGVGGASVEAEFVDSESQKRVLAFMDARKGKAYKYTKGLSKWGHTKDVLKQWAEDIAARLNGEEIGKKKE